MWWFMACKMLATTLLAGVIAKMATGSRLWRPWEWVICSVPVISDEYMPTVMINAIDQGR